jgi:hypothetical protein|tara:strand:- start:465 stop:1394 length:930 start_codon:yes stop_codon:yes gene_type:complete
MAEEKLEQEVLEDEGVEVEIEVKEEEPVEQEVVVKEDAAEEVESASAEPETTEDELETYSSKVQNRIKKLTEKYRKEERDREEAVRMAQQLLGENQQLKSRMQNLDKGYLSEYGTRLDSETTNAKRLYKEAYEAGDADKMMEAQEAMSRMSIEQERLRIAKQRSEQVEVEQGQAQGQPAPQQAAPQQNPAPKPDPKAEAWAEKNEWFGSDEVMTYAAFGIHRKLVEEEGIDPTANDYYTEVDKRMRLEFPHKFQAAKKSGGAQVAPAGASATRSTAKTGRRSVKLSPSQIAMAKRLNVPLEEYAKYVKD